MNQESSSPLRGVGPLLFVFGCWALVLVVSIICYGPVTPLSESAPANQFSAGRAKKILTALVGDSIPHPAGSPQNRVVRERIVGFLESYGYEVDIQVGTGKVPERAKHRSPDHDEVELHNIIAIRKARTDQTLPMGTAVPRKAIMLAAHYDSVPYGPGASDDGVGTSAILEIARMMALGPDPERDVVFLITDGEEFGLMGARMFVDDHPLADRIGAVVNLEARGTTGPSMMFETSDHSRMLIRIFARTSQRPFTSSLFYEIYKRMPRDTDFTLFKRNGMLGYNFVFIGNVRNYHTSVDNIENVDWGCLQHHGENALGLIHGLLDSEELHQMLDQPPEQKNSAEASLDNAVYFDVFGRWLAVWPCSWSKWFCVAGGLFFCVAVFRINRSIHSDDRELKKLQLIRGTIKQIVLLVGLTVVMMVSGYVIQMTLRLDPRLSSHWPMQPIPILCGFWFASFAIVGGIVLITSNACDPRSAWIALSLVWMAFAVLTSAFVNGASYLFILPWVATSMFAMLASGAGKRGMVAIVVIAAVCIGFIWLPLERGFYDAVGFKMPGAMFFRISMVATSLPGLLSIVDRRTRFVFTILMAVLSVAALVIALFMNTDV